MRLSRWGSAIGGSLPSSMTDENRNFGVRKHLRGHAAEHDCRNPAPSVRGHDDEIAPSPLGSLDDAFVGMILFDLHGFACHTRGARTAPVVFFPRVRQFTGTRGGPGSAVASSRFSSRAPHRPR